MTPYTLIGALGTVVVGGGVATGFGFALKPSSNASSLENSMFEDGIAPPNN